MNTLPGFTVRWFQKVKRGGGWGSNTVSAMNVKHPSKARPRSLGEALTHTPVDIIEQITKPPLVTLAILSHEEKIVRLVARSLNDTDVCPHHVRGRVLSSELLCPNTGTCSDVEDVRRIVYWCKIQSAIEHYLECMVLKIQSVLFVPIIRK